MMLLLFALICNANATTNSFFEDMENFRSKNLAIQSQEQKLIASSEDLFSRKLFWTPKLSLSAQESRTQLNSSPTIKSSSIGADLSLNLFRGGADWSALKEAQAQNALHELQLLNEVLRTEIASADTIFKSLYLLEIENVQKQLLKLKSEALRIVTDRYRQGKLPLQEVTKSEVDYTQQKSRVRSASLDLKENQSQIASLFVESIKTIQWPFDERTAPRLPVESQIPLVEEKFWLAKSQEESWKASKALHWPSLDLQIQRRELPLSARTDKQWIGVVSLSFPLWNQWETTARISSAYAGFVGTLNDYKNTEQALKQKNIFLKEKIETARLNLSEAKRNLEISRQLYQDILSSFRLGRISINDLFIEQNRLLESENSLALSQLNFHQSLIESCALAGVKAFDCLK